MAGQYLTEDGILEVRVHEGRLYWLYPGEPRRRLWPTAQDEYIARDNGGWALVSRNASGQILGLQGIDGEYYYPRM